MNLYTVTAERSVGIWWSLQCEEVPRASSQVARLDHAADSIRGAIAAAADVPVDSVAIDLVPILPRAVAVALAVSEEARHSAAEQAARATAAARHVVVLLREENLTTREIGTVLGISHQRVNQLLKDADRQQEINSVALAEELRGEQEFTYRN